MPFHAWADDLTGAAEMGMTLFPVAQHANGAVGVLYCHSQALPNTTLHANEKSACTAINLQLRQCSDVATAARAFDQWLLSSPPSRVKTQPYLKVDSTWRGYPGTLLLKTMKAFQVRIGILCPAYPEMGRTIENGHALLNGLPLHQTPVARDPQHPRHTSDTQCLLQQELDALHQAIPFSMPDFIVGKFLPEALTLLDTYLLSDLKSSTQSSMPRVIWVPDIQTRQELDALVCAVGKRFTPQQVLWAGSAGLLKALVNPLNSLISPTPNSIPIPRQHEWGIISGSLNPVTLKQIQFARNAFETLTSYPNPKDKVSHGTAWERALSEWVLQHGSSRKGWVLCGGETAHITLRTLNIQTLHWVQNLNAHCALWRDNTLQQYWVFKSGNMGEPELLVHLLNKFL
jgi:uncharacterized protein YgbK (DUF1537 family)